MQNIKNDRVYDEDIYLNPDYVYIPFGENDSLSVKTNEVKMGSSILTGLNSTIYSPVSGMIVGKTDTVCLNNKKINALVIENDFKETKKSNKGVVKNYTDYDREDILLKLEKYNLKRFNFNKKDLVVSLIDIDPYEKVFSHIVSKKLVEVLDTVDLLATKFGFKKVYLVIHNQDYENVLTLTNNLGSYPNIKLKLTSNLYPLGRKEVLLDYLKVPNACFLTAEDVLNIYNALRCNKAVYEKYITVYGNAIKNPINIKVKIGTTIDSLIKNKIEIIDNNYDIIKNGLIGGLTITDTKEIIDENTRSIMFQKPDKRKPSSCINCGLCTIKCPKGLDPKYILKHKKSVPKECLHCNLCSYICPARINFKEYLDKGDKDE